MFKRIVTEYSDADGIIAAVITVGVLVGCGIAGVSFYA